MAPVANSPQALPRGPHRLGSDAVVASQRARLIAAITEEVNLRGFSATTVAAVIRRAGISRKTFYELFDNKDECFLAAFDQGQEQLIESVVAATTSAGDDPDARLHAGYAALCAGLAAQPAFARAFLIAAPAAGEAVQARRVAWREASIERLCWLYRTAPKREPGTAAELSPQIARAIVGAVEALVTDQVEREEPESLPLIVPTIVAVARALMFGTDGR